MTVQEMLRIALRYFTRMSDAMIAACAARAAQTGEPLDIPERKAAGRRAEKRPTDDMGHDEWRRLMEGNSDSRWQHV